MWPVPIRAFVTRCAAETSRRCYPRLALVRSAADMNRKDAVWRSLARSLIFAAVLALALLPRSTRLADAQQPGLLRFASDTRIARVGNPVLLRASGLDACAGELVEMGFFGPGFTGELWSLSRVDADGAAVAQLWPSQPSTLRAGIRADCLDGGPVEGDVILHVVDPGSAIPISEPPRQRGLDFLWGEDPYRYPTILARHLVTLELTGIPQCAGREVEVGFFAGLWGEDTYATALISEDGSASVELRPMVSAGDQRAGVIGSCLGGGFTLSGRAAYVFEWPADGGPAFQIAVPKMLLDMPPPLSDQDEHSSVGQLLDHLRVFADGQECGTLSLVDPAVIDRDGNPLFELGVAGQHPYCSTTMALVTLVDRHGRTLDEVWTIDPETTAVVDNLAPQPPHGPATSVIIPVFLAHYEGTAERFDHIVVLAEGQVCGNLSLVEPKELDQQGNLVFRLGGPAQPAACNREGALISFRDPAGKALLATFTLRQGEIYVLRNFAPPPRGDPDPPGPPDVGTGVVSNRSSGQLRTAAIGLIALGLVAAVIAFRRERRQV